MSSTGTPQPPSAYSDGTGPDRYIRWVEDYLGIYVSESQREILRSLAENKKTLAYGANGYGKTFILACGALAFQNTNYPAAVFGTSGTFAKLRRTFCKPLEALHDNALGGAGLPGTYKHQPPRIEIDGEPEHYLEVASPEDAGELEGVHSAYTLGIIEEADKDAVDRDVIDSMGSLVTDDRDRLFVVANPPEDEANVVYDLIEDPTWNVIQFSSFDSHNVQVELGEVDGGLIDGLATLGKIKDDWISFNGEDWPGAETARTAHERRDDLDTRWYRRRAGVIPPDGASEHRPFSVEDVEAAWDRDPTDTQPVPSGVGIDVARAGGDRTVLAGVHGDDLRIHDDWQGTDHNENEANLREYLSEWVNSPTAIDASPEGSGLADSLKQSYPCVHRFMPGGKPADGEAFYDARAEGLEALGEWLRSGGSITDRRLREELLVAARVLSYEEKHYASRGEDGAEVLKVTSKDDIKERLGRSPDFLDAAYQAVWASEGRIDEYTKETRRRRPGTRSRRTIQK